ncbi:RsiX protein [Bacillus swezeyi]|uniref:RsiX protein n=1 Tax=Bacillus swezeyi TaxID=1925020 RepID=A0A1R1QFW1_9BACI|nr:RsiX protein [Bacillus swezeyi]MEC1260491.1 RsiX protein [Bacillus swezeyi]MED2929594.1 RsiX protein [Bacillus swezeyi]MED2943657.1 RsiX protein [Bacillus swezeyi]MED2963379.1 RsiX protein [Bacillus swezeyi]MED2979199.1 RsiX protein [Bacillus swezeyi]
MKKSEWNEDRLKALLSQLPTVKDNRSANQVYQKLILTKPKSKSPKKRAGAFAATVLVLFLLMLMTPQLIEQIRSQNGTDANISSDGKLESGSMEMADAARSEPASTFVVSPEQKDNYITFAFLDESKSVVVPVSLQKNGSITDIEDALSVYTDLGVGQFTSFNTTYLQQVELNEEKKSKKVKIQVNEKIPGLSVEDFELLKEVINQTFKWDSYDSVFFVSKEGEQDVDFDSFGMLADMAIIHETQRGYFLYESSDGRPFLAPSTESYENIQEAIKDMRNEESGSHLKSIMTGDMPIQDVQAKGKELTIRFSSAADIQNQTADILMVEGLLLTAKDFGFTKVKFKNANTNKVGSYDLSKSVQVPYAPNPMTIKG